MDTEVWWAIVHGVVKSQTDWATKSSTFTPFPSLLSTLSILSLTPTSNLCPQQIWLPFSFFDIISLCLMAKPPRLHCSTRSWMPNFRVSRTQNYSIHTPSHIQPWPHVHAAAPGTTGCLASNKSVMIQEGHHLICIPFLPFSLSPSCLAESAGPSSYGVYDHVVV